MKIYICSNENQLIGAKVSKYSIMQRSKYKDDDIRIILDSDFMEMQNFFSKPHFRNGKKTSITSEDLQSFTLLRFIIPELMQFSGRALVIDPDIFQVKDGIELLEQYNKGDASIYARKGTKKGSWSSSVMLLSCNKLRHWSLKSLINRLHDDEIDYADLISLRLEEEKILPLETRWNEFDAIKPETVLLHTTEKLTQPWRTGLKLNSYIPPLFNFFPRAPIYKIFGKDLTIGREHPEPNIVNFFMSELKRCMNDGVISNQEIASAIAKGFVRKDIFSIMDKLK